MRQKQKRVAIVYDRVNKWGGAERVLLTLLELFPDATLFTSVYDKKGAPWASQFKSIKTSFLQRIPFAKQNHEYLAPLMPMAFESFTFKKYDLVISVTSEAAKGIIVPPGTLHICYCLTPTRYLWSGRREYFSSPILKTLGDPFVHYLRKWDKAASNRPDHMIGISTTVQNRIQKYYARPSTIIFPPVEVKRFSSKIATVGEYYLVVSRFVKYKKVDIAIKAFNKLSKKLLIVGSGRQEKYLKKISKKNITFVGNVSDTELAHIYAGAKALIFPQVEDFGIVSVEAQSAGVPVIAYRKAGAIDTVIPEVTGIFFNKQTTKSLINAIEVFEHLSFDKTKIKKEAQKFSKERFLQEFATMLKTI